MVSNRRLRPDRLWRFGWPCCDAQAEVPDDEWEPVEYLNNPADRQLKRKLATATPVTESSSYVFGSGEGVSRLGKAESDAANGAAMIAPRGRFTPAVKIQPDTAIAAGEPICLKRGGDLNSSHSDSALRPEVGLASIGDSTNAMTNVLENIRARSSWPE
jgi:hypothetical protein